MTLQEVGHIQNILAAIIATGAAVIYNLAKHRHDKDVFKSKLFFSFNERFEKIFDSLYELTEWEATTNIQSQIAPYENQDLDHVLEEAMTDPYGSSQKIFLVVSKYASLCSEQYHWYKKGFVDEGVWESWRVAMLTWFKSSLTFRKFIENEKDRGVSYYEKDFLSLFPASE